ncbi:RCC1 domain-containing protein [Streptomyces sp. SID9727]|nr:RCC1 domain-containing protein [Streptomyces sp. SID9727]NEC67192.1 hypothetical protein [Streptomyces sp. SID9727]
MLVHASVPAAGRRHAVGLRRDGTLLAAGSDLAAA